MQTASLTYASYLRLDKLLDAQEPKSEGPEHDELLFIVIHQVYELWFKQLLHELDHAMILLKEKDQFRVMHTFHRMLTILKTVVSQIDILETMTPLEFNSFRSYLEASSGFQSRQFREFEFMMGHKRKGMIEHFAPGPDGQDRLIHRFEKPTLWDGFLGFLADRGCMIPKTCLSRDVTQPIEPSPALQEALVLIYRTQPDLAMVCERLVDLDEGLLEWRYRHVKMVQRTIGTKRGTGGSAGAKYLETTLKPLYPDLWAIRAQF